MPAQQDEIAQLQQQLFAQQAEIEKYKAKSKPPLLSKKLLYGGGIFIIILILVAVVVSIYGNQQPAAPTQSTVKFWGKSVDKEVMEEIIKDFEAENPLIKIEYDRQIDTNYKERVTTRLKLNNTPQLPDIVEIDEPWVDEIGQYLVSVENPQLFSKYANISLNNNKYAQAVVAIPYKFDSLVLAYNKPHLKELGITEADLNKLDWSSLLRRAESLTKVQKTTNPTTKVTTEKITRGGIAVGSPETVTNANRILELLLIQNETDIYDAKLKKFTLTTEFDQVIKFYTNFAISKTWDNSLGNDIDAFSKGNLSMILVRSGDLDAIKKKNPSLSFGTVIPARIGLVKNISLSTSLAYPIVRGGNFAASSKFVEYLTKTETGMKLFNSTNSNTFIPSQLATLSQIPQDSPFYVFANINSSAQKFNSPNYEETSTALDNFLTKSFNSYYALQTGGQVSREFRVDKQTLESNLNAIVSPKPTTK